jgi:hypothetical protein
MERVEIPLTGLKYKEHSYGKEKESFFFNWPYPV